jgi:hypothetical protein
VIEGIAWMLQGEPRKCVDMRLENGLGPVTAICLQAAGEAARASGLIDSLEASAARDRLGIYTLGFIGAYYARVGDPAKTVEWLSKAYAVSPTAFDTRFVDSALFDKVRSDPVFQRGWDTIRGKVRSRFG